MSNNKPQGNFIFPGTNFFFEKKMKTDKKIKRKSLKRKAGKNQPSTFVNDANKNRATPQQTIAINPSFTPTNNLSFLLLINSLRFMETKTIPKAIKIMAINWLVFKTSLRKTTPKIAANNPQEAPI